MRASKGQLEKIAEELEVIEGKNGILHPKAVIEYARKHKRSTLHKQFEWNDGVAAEAYRLNQAQNIIRVCVKVIERPDDGEQVVVANYVSLPDHRGQGYESVVTVLEDDGRREVLLIDTIRRLAAIKETRLFPELDAVSQSIERVVQRYIPSYTSPEAKKRRGGKTTGDEAQP